MGGLVGLSWSGDRAARKRWLYAGAGIALAALSLISWTYINRPASAGSDDPGGEQLRWLSAHPGEVPKIAFNTLLTLGDDYLIQLVMVRDLVHRQMRFLGGLVVGSYLTLLLAVTLGASRRALHARPRLRWVAAWIALLGLASMGGVFLAMYLYATPLGAGVVRGAQGRYFIPIVPALLMLVSTFGSPALGRWLTKNAGLRLKIALSLLNVATVLALVVRYYGSNEVDWPY